MTVVRDLGGDLTETERKMSYLNEFDEFDRVNYERLRPWSPLASFSITAPYLIRVLSLGQLMRLLVLIRLDTSKMPKPATCRLQRQKLELGLTLTQGFRVAPRRPSPRNQLIPP